jgi:PHD/YefM family antitoxin component YafN of YafNO toxin-antitoxin module
MNGTLNIPISRLKQEPGQVIDEMIASGQPAVIFQRSRPRAVIADFDYFNSLETSLIDLLDAREAEKAKKEPTISLDSYVKKRWGGNNAGFYHQKSR